MQVTCFVIVISAIHLSSGLVKLLQILAPIESTSKVQYDNAKFYKNKNNQSNHQLIPHIDPHPDILLWVCDNENSRDVQLTLPKNPISLEIRHLRRTEPQEPIAIYAVC